MELQKNKEGHGILQSLINKHALKVLGSENQGCPPRLDHGQPSRKPWKADTPVSDLKLCGFMRILPERSTVFGTRLNHLPLRQVATTFERIAQSISKHKRPKQFHPKLTKTTSQIQNHTIMGWNLSACWPVSLAHPKIKSRQCSRHRSRPPPSWCLCRAWRVGSQA